MLTFLIFLIFLVIPFLYCLKKQDLKLFLLYAVFTFWVPISLPFTGVFEQITIPEFFIYACLLVYFSNKKSVGEATTAKFSKKLVLSFFLLLIGCFTSMFSSVDNKYLFVGFRQTFLIPLSVVFILSKIKIEIQFLRKISFFLTLGLVIFLLTLYFHPKTFSFLQYRGISQEQFRLGGEYMLLGKYSGIFYEATVGAFLGFVIPFLITFYKIEKKPLRRIIYVFAFLFLAISIILAAGRSGWTAGIIGIIIIYLGSMKKGQKFFTLSLTIAISTAFIYLIFGMIVPTFTIEGKLFERIISFGDIGKADNFLIRVYQWIWAWDVFLKNPLGIGFWNFTVFTNSLFAGNSTWLTMLLNVGIIGTLGFAILFFDTLALALKNFFRGDESGINIGLFASLISFSIGASTENFFESGLYVSLPFWVIVGLIQNISHNNFNENRYEKNNTKR